MCILQDVCMLISRFTIGTAVRKQKETTCVHELHSYVAESKQSCEFSDVPLRAAKFSGFAKAPCQNIVH